MHRRLGVGQRCRFVEGQQHLPALTQRPSTITESTALRAAMLHQRVLSRRERQSADATASH